MPASSSPRGPLRGPVVDPVRLAAIDEAALLEDGAVEAFDRITRLVSMCLDAPGAFISVVDHDRQYFKSGVGLPPTLSQIPVSAAICRHVVETHDTVAIADARKDPRTRGNPIVERYGVIAYAGAPLANGDGLALGTICAFDYAARPWSERQLAILAGLADLAADEIVLRNQRLARERHLAIATRLPGLDVADEALALADELAAEDAREDTVRRLARVVEVRSEETGRHMSRMSTMCGVLAAGLGLPPARCTLIRQASMLHDIGKIVVPDQILLKPGPLTPAERTLMERHVVVGHEMLGASDDPVLRLAAVIALTHHERPDGTGYPNGLRGDEIPVEGRIAAVADVFDALTSDRVYRRALPFPVAFELMQQGRGTQFDPRVLDALAGQVEILCADAEAAAADQRRTS